VTKSARRVSGHFKTFIKVKLRAEKVKGLHECLKSLRKNYNVAGDQSSCNDSANEKIHLLVLGQVQGHSGIF